MLDIALRRGALTGVAISVLALAAPAQQTGRAGPTEMLPSLAVLAGYDSLAGSVQVLDLPQQPGPFQVVVTIRGEGKVLDLHPYDVRSPGFRLLVDDGRTVRQLPTPESVTYRGQVEGHPRSLVAGSFVDGQLDAVVQLEPDSTFWGVQPVSRFDASAPRAAHFVYDRRDNRPLPFRCGNTELGAPEHGGNHGGGDPEALRIAEIAIEADVEFYQLNGSSTTATQNDVTNVMNLVDTIYRRDTEIGYTVTTILVTTSSVYSSNNPSTLLNQFLSRWNSVHGGIRRDVAHLFTGRNLDGSVIGVAYLGVVCNIGSAYGLSQSRFSSNMTSRACLTAHELGHNWNAPHCSGSDCRIMCAGLGGCSGDCTRFGAASISTIVGFKNSRGCLSNPTPPSISSLAPNSIQAFPSQQLTLTGANLSGATSVRVGPTTLGTGQFSVFSDTEIRFGSPLPAALGGAAVSVTTPAGTSNQLTLTYGETLPAQHTISPFGIAGFPLTAGMGMKPNDTWFLIATFNNNATVRILGFDILSANPVTLATGTLNGAGLANIQIPVPNVSLTGIRMYTQAAAISQVPLALNRVTAVQLTTFF